MDTELIMPGAVEVELGEFKLIPGPPGEAGPRGPRGYGIESAVLNPDFTLTLRFEDGSSCTTSSIRGDRGVGISEVEIEPGDHSVSPYDTLRLTLTDGEAKELLLYNGAAESQRAAAESQAAAKASETAAKGSEDKVTASAQAAAASADNSEASARRAEAAAETAAADAAEKASETAARQAAEKAVWDAEELMSGYVEETSANRQAAETAAQGAAEDVRALLSEYVTDSAANKDAAQTAASAAKASETAAKVSQDAAKASETAAAGSAEAAAESAGGAADSAAAALASQEAAKKSQDGAAASQTAAAESAATAGEKAEAAGESAASAGQAAQNASASGESASAAADAAQKSAQAAEGSASAAGTAKDGALEAQGAAEDAAGRAGTARDGAESAAAQAAQDAGRAESARTGAETARDEAQGYSESAAGSAETAKEYSGNPPRVGEDGCWEVWNAESGAYVTTGKPARGEQGPVGPAGKDGEGSGDMEKAVYDPEGRATDVFKYVDQALAGFSPGGELLPRQDPQFEGTLSTQAQLEDWPDHTNSVTLNAGGLEIKGWDYEPYIGYSPMTASLEAEGGLRFSGGEDEFGVAYGSWGLGVWDTETYGQLFFEPHPAQEGYYNEVVITGVGDPTEKNGAANKRYADDAGTRRGQVVYEGKQLNGGDIIFDTIVFGNGRFVSYHVGDEHPYVLKDDEWVPAEADVWMAQLFFCNGEFVLRDNRYNTDIELYVSRDGESWTRKATDISLTEREDYVSMAYGNGTYVLVCPDNGKIFYSSDGSAWTEADVKDLRPLDYTVVYGAGKFLGLSSNTIEIGVDTGYILESVDGRVWEITRRQEDIELFEASKTLIYANGKFAAVYEHGDVYLSEDGKTWSKHTAGGEYLRSVAYGDGKFLVTGDDGDWAYSEDGESWTTLPRPEGAGWGEGHDLAFGDGVFVTGHLASADGIHWSDRWPEKRIWVNGKEARDEIRRALGLETGLSEAVTVRASPGGVRLGGIAQPQGEDEAATKQYVDEAIAALRRELGIA